MNGRILIARTGGIEMQTKFEAGSAFRISKKGKDEFRQAVDIAKKTITEMYEPTAGEVALVAIALAMVGPSMCDHLDDVVVVVTDEAFEIPILSPIHCL